MSLDSLIKSSLDLLGAVSVAGIKDLVNYSVYVVGSLAVKSGIETDILCKEGRIPTGDTLLGACSAHLALIDIVHDIARQLNTLAVYKRKSKCTGS